MSASGSRSRGRCPALCGAGRPSPARPPLRGWPPPRRRLPPPRRPPPAPARGLLGCGASASASAPWPRLGSASPRPLPRARRPAAVSPPSSRCLDQRRDPVGEVARQGLEQAGHLLHRRGQRAGQAGQQHFAGRQVGQRGQVGRREQRPVGQPALDHQVRVGPGEVPQRLGHRADVALDEGQRARAAQVLRQRLVLAAVDRPAHERVLEDLVVAAGGGERRRAVRPSRPRSGRGTRSRWRPSPRRCAS